MSSPPAKRTRKLPAERRDEMLAAAAAIALESGLERITLRAVAERLGVRPGLVSHYFPLAEDLVVAAFARAIAGEREALLASSGSPLSKVRRMVARAEGPDSRDAARLWLNARHLSRSMAALAKAVADQESLDRARLTEVIEDGVRDGVFVVDSPSAACIRIFMAIDGLGAYVNDAEPFTEPAYLRFVGDVTEWSLGLRPGTLRTISDSDG